MKKTVTSVMLITVIAKLLSFARELFLTYYLGATGISDAYLISQTIPGTIFQFVGNGLTTCFIPVYLGIVDRTLVSDCPRLLIPMINEIFDEHFTKEDEIVFSKDIYKFNGRAENAETRMTDSVFEIIGVVRKRYLLECQVNPDNSMLVRMFEYATLVALRCRIEEDQILRVDYPNCAVLFLRSTRSTPDKMEMKITSPQGNLSVDVLVMKVRDYTLEEMIAKDLLFLFPFYLFKFSKYRLKQCNEDPERLKTITNDYRRIASYLEELTEKGGLSEFYHRTLIELSNKVVGKLARNYGNVVKGVDEIMGGKLIETDL